MIPLHLFRSRNFSGANLLTLFLYSALGGILFFFPLNLIQVQDHSPTQAGAALLPLIFLVFLLSRLVRRTDGSIWTQAPARDRSPGRSRRVRVVYKA